MTIKEIKEKYKDYSKNYCFGGKVQFRVTDYGDEDGKCVIIVIHDTYGRDVVQVVRVSDGKEMLTEGRCRPCDNMDDAEDVASEMLSDDGWYRERWEGEVSDNDSQ